MKFISFAILLIGISLNIGAFVEAESLNLKGLLAGLLDLLPALTDAANGFKNFAKGTTAVAKAMENNTKCGSSGSNETVPNLAEGNQYLAQNISAFGMANMQQTSDNGQLVLLNKNLSDVTNTGHGVARGLDAVTEQLYDTAEYIEENGILRSNQLNAALKKVAQALVVFNKSYFGFTGVSKGVLNLSTLLSGLDRTVNEAVAALKKAKKAAEDEDERCNIESGLPESIGEVLHEGEETVQLLQLLNLS